MALVAWIAAFAIFTAAAAQPRSKGGCGQHCNRCGRRSRCIECADGFELDASSESCARPRPCGELCADCSPLGGTFSRCVDGAVRLYGKGAFTCFPRSTDCPSKPHCSECAGGMCLECEPGYRFKKNAKDTCMAVAGSHDHAAVYATVGSIFFVAGLILFVACCSPRLSAAAIRRRQLLEQHQTHRHQQQQRLINQEAALRVVQQMNFLTTELARGIETDASATDGHGRRLDGRKLAVDFGSLQAAGASNPVLVVDPQGNIDVGVQDN